MSSIQRFFKSILPKKWAQDMEADSRRWMMQCPCGFERSIWELGGIRWKATGNSKNLGSCPQCGKTSWHTLYKKEM